ncbi:MAG: hypothetical protein V3U86_10025, partial [Acidobacteriota bacterium]
MRIMRTVVAAVFLSIPLLMIMQQAEAAKPGGKGKQAPMFISGVNFLELGAKTRLEISGVSFDNGAFPVVSLDGAGELMVVSATATLIEADILPKVPDGDYTLRVSTGSLSKQNAALDLHFGGSMSIVCLDWYLTTGNGQHVHVEAFVQDEAGNPVIGAIVTMENTRDDGAGSVRSPRTLRRGTCGIRQEMGRSDTAEFHRLSGNAVDRSSAKGRRADPIGPPAILKPA